MRWLPCLLLALTLTAPAAAQAKRSVFASDDRLAKPVTVRWKKATLFEALRELKRLTGVDLTPDRGVVDEPFMASATNIPARDLLDQMAVLTRFTWVRYGGTPEKPGYLLFKDRVAAQEEEEEITRSRRAVLEALQQQIENLRRLSRLSPQQLQAETDRVSAELEKVFAGGFAGAVNSPAAGQKMLDSMTALNMATSNGRAMVDLLNSLSPGQWQQVMAEEPLIFSTQPAFGESRMPPAMQDRFREAAPGIPYPKSLFRSLGADLEKAIGQAEEMMRAEWGKATGYKVTVQLSLNLGAQPLGMLRVSPEPLGVNENVAPVFAASGLNLLGAPTVFEAPKEDPAEREKRLAADPVLGKKAKLKLPALQQPEGAGGFLAILGQGYRVPDLLEPVETAFGVRLLGDAFNQKALAVVTPPGEGELPLYKILDQMGGTTRDWELDGNLVRLKSKNWAFDRRSEIPARYMQRWLAAREKKGGFNLDDLAEIASMLRDEQVENLMYSALEAGASEFNDFVMISSNRDALRFWGGLLPLQRKNLAAGARIAASTLYPRQQAAMVKATSPKGGGMFAAFMGGRKRRSPELLARAVIALEIADLQGRTTVQAGPGRGTQPVNATGLYTLRFSYPDGQSDQFRIPIMPPDRTGRATAREQVQPEPPMPSKGVPE